MLFLFTAENISVVEIQVPPDPVFRTGGTQWRVVFSLCNLCYRPHALNSVSDFADPGPQPSYLDEGGDWDRGARCLTDDCAMVPRNEWTACGTPAASVGQEAHGEADLETQQRAGCRIQRVPQHDTRRQLREDQFFSRQRTYIQR